MALRHSCVNTSGSACHTTIEVSPLELGITQSFRGCVSLGTAASDSVAARKLNSGRARFQEVLVVCRCPVCGRWSATESALRCRTIDTMRKRVRFWQFRKIPAWTLVVASRLLSLQVSASCGCLGHVGSPRPASCYLDLALLYGRCADSDGRNSSASRQETDGSAGHIETRLPAKETQAIWH